MRALQIPRAVRQALAERSGGACERDACGRAVQAHHRRPRGAGGSRRPETNMLPNLLHVSLGCHMDIESNRAESLNRGWLVRQAHDPRVIPVKYRDYPNPMFLREDGSIEEGTDAELLALFGKGYEGVA